MLTYCEKEREDERRRLQFRFDAGIVSFGRHSRRGARASSCAQSGEETRKKIRDFAGDVKDKTTDYVEKTKDKITSYVDDGKGLYEQKKSIVKSAIEAGKEAYEKEKERLAKEHNA